MPHDHLKSIALAGALIASIIAVIAWSICATAPMTAGMVVGRFGMPVIAVACFALTIRALRRPDLAPDYLKQMFGRRRFDCRGFSFALDMSAEDGIAWLETGTNGPRGRSFMFAACTASRCPRRSWRWPGR